MARKQSHVTPGLGPFGSTKGEMKKAKAFLAKHGIPTTSNKPKYVQRVANGVVRQLAQGLPANRQASRGHITTAEHTGRKPPTMKRVSSPAYKGRKGTVAPRTAQMQEYLRVRARTRNEVIPLPSGDMLYISGRPKFILNGLKDAVAQGRRVDIQVYLTNGKEFTLFNNARYRTRQHAIDAQVLLDQLEASGFAQDDALAEAMADALHAYGTSPADVSSLRQLSVLQLELTTYA